MAFDTTNRFLVGMKGDHIVTLIRVPPALTKLEAQQLGVWLCALAFDGPEEAGAALTAVLNT